MPKKQQDCYSGKKKTHTLKQQLLIDIATGKILCTYGCNGKKHDFKLFLKSGVRMLKQTVCLADSGYQGIEEIHSNALIPKKKSMKSPLKKQEKSYNRKLARARVKVENVLAHLKKFRIFSGKYRNRKKRLGLRFNLISAIYNIELNL